MKCPKCEYLGFETGDRCKNCGYDFSLAADLAAPRDVDLPLREPESTHRDADRWLNQLEARLDTVRPVALSSTASDPLASMSLDAPAAIPTVVPQPAPAPVAAPAPPVQPPAERLISRSTPALPLFHPGGADWDEPLIKVPAAPRPPLSVRRTPDKPRLRSLPKPVRRMLFRNCLGMMESVSTSSRLIGTAMPWMVLIGSMSVCSGRKQLRIRRLRR